MRICLIVPGGVDRSGTRRVMPFIVALLERLAARHDVHVIALFQEPEPCTYDLRGARVYNIGRGRTAVRALQCIRRLHRESPLDVLHAIWASPAGALGAVASRVLHRPLLVHLLGGELVALPDIAYGEQRTLRGRTRVRLALASARRVTAQSDAMVRLAERAGFHAQRLPLGIDLRSWPPRDPRPRDPGRPARLVHVASINQVKDPFTLVRSAALLRDQGVRFELDMIGEDTLDGRVQRAVGDAGLGDRIRFHGFLETDALRPLVEHADLLVHASRHEAGPAVTLEAGAVGVPTVGTAVGHIAEWAPDAAVAVPVGQAAALADAIRDLLEDDDRRMRLGGRARERAVAENADVTADRFDLLYREVSAA